MDNISHIDIDFNVKKWVGEEDEQNIYKNLFYRRLRIDADFAISMKSEWFRKAIHDSVDKILDDFSSAMEK